MAGYDIIEHVGKFMRILQINCVYDKGSTGKITRDIHNYLIANNIESIVCYGRGTLIKDKNIYKTCSELEAKINNLISRFSGIMYGGCFFSTNKLIRIIKSEKPDIVHLQCINGYFVNIYKLIEWLKRNKIKTVLTLHAEFMYTANCGYALDCNKWLEGCGHCPRLKRETKSWFWDRTADSYKKMKKAFEGFEKNIRIISVSPWLKERAEKSPVLGNMEHRVILNGIDTDIFKHSKNDRLRSDLGISDEKIVFHVTASFNDDPEHIKGGYYVLELAKKLKDQPIKFVVAGKYVLSGEMPENVIFLGEIKDQCRLAELYSIADVTLLTSKKETFSMICAESLCCGTPIAGFKAGAPEVISLPEYSEFVEHGNVDALAECLTSAISRYEGQNLEISKRAQEIYSKECMAGNYMSIYEEIL